MGLTEELGLSGSIEEDSVGVSVQSGQSGSRILVFWAKQELNFARASHRGTQEQHFRGKNSRVRNRHLIYETAVISRNIAANLKISRLKYYVRIYIVFCTQPFSANFQQILHTSHILMSNLTS